MAATAEQIAEQAQLLVRARSERLTKVDAADAAQKAADAASDNAKTAETFEDDVFATLKSLVAEYVK